MEILQITKENAVKAYNEGNDKQKALLINLFGKKHFQLSAIERIKSYEDACEELGLSPQYTNSLFSKTNDPRNRQGNAAIQLGIIAEALNEGWVPDWTNTNQIKYTVRGYDYVEGKGFSDVDSCYWASGCGVGSRLCFKSSEIAMYAATTFPELWNDFLNS